MKNTKPNVSPFLTLKNQHGIKNLLLLQQNDDTPLLTSH